MKDNAKYILFAIILSVITIAISHLVQPEISFNNGLGWDGVNYHQMAEQIANGEQVSTKAPFVSRVGLPYLVAKVYPDNIKSGFLYLNWFFSILNSILLALLLARFINRKWVIYLLVFMYITQWHGYHRFGTFYPVQVDPLAISLLLASLLVLLKRGITLLDIILLSVITLLGTFVREIVVIPSVLIIAKAYFYYKKSKFTELVEVNKLIIFLPLIFFLTIYAIVALSVEPTNSHKFYNAAADMLYTKSLFRFFHSWIVAYGAVIILPALFYRKTIDYLKQHKIMATYIAIIIVFSYVGGADTERIAYWGFPVVFILAGRILDEIGLTKANKNFLYALLLIQVVSQRLFSIIPDFPSDCNSTTVLLTPIGNCFPYLNLFPAHSELIPAVIGFAEWSAVIVVLWWWKRGMHD
ncbi:MAG: hypothetical protein KDC55_09445 [Ignavibacteriae bacterium]|nr:hypothetical protein [Ignavibacteriota bacterium]MCB9221383.1 hypothetical protein [Ignavibacteria bacterium]